MTFNRSDLAALVGYPARPRVPDVIGRETVAAGGIAVERLRLAIGDEAVPATFVRPAGEGPFPAVLYCHAHGARYHIGMSELLDGRPALRGPYGPELAARGFAAFCVEMPTFGARQEPNESSRAKAHLWHGTTLFGQMLAELAGGLAWLRARPDIDASRIATFGISMGATHAFWLAALDPGINRTAHLCSFADLATLISEGVHDMHGIYMMVPGLLATTSTGEIAGLIAPRPQLIGVGYRDEFTSPAAVAKACAETRAAYAAAGVTDAPTLLADPGTAHEETPAMRAAVLAFLDDMKR